MPTVPRIRLRLTQIGILATFALLPVWKRFSVQEPPPLLLPNLYVSYFWILLPILWSIAWWLIAGWPGFAALRRDTLRGGWALALLLLALWALASPLWAFMRDAHPEVGSSASLQFSVVALFAVVVACAAPSPRAIIAVLVIGVLWNGLLALFQEAYQGSVGLRAVGEFPISINQPGVSVIQSGAIRWLRPYGLLPHPNMLAGFLAVGLLSVVEWMLSQRRFVWWAGVLIFVIGWWALLLTFSRGAWLGFAVGTFTMFLFMLRFNRQSIPRMPESLTPPIKKLLGNLATWRFKVLSRPLFLFAVTIIITIPFAVTFRPLLAARAGVGEESLELRSISDRIVFAAFAYRSILERPVIGVGIGNFPWRTSYYLTATDYDLIGDNVHHVLLSIWTELGLVGFVLAMSALGLGVEAALRRLRTGDHTANVGLFSGFIALTVIGLLDHYPWTILHLQISWWGLLAASINNNSPHDDTGQGAR